jgi:thiamine-phosphate pyrophosphorylase
MGTEGALKGLYGMIDRSASPHRSHRDIAEALIRAEVRVLQLRDKEATDDELRELIENLLPLTASSGAHLILNDRLHIAAEFPQVGVHLGQEDASPHEARELLGDGVLIGKSTHTLEQVISAHRLPIDYVGFGPIFTAAGKHRSQVDQREPMSSRGTEKLAEAVRFSTLPIVAIGGINEDNLQDVLETGVMRVAAIGAVTCADDMTQAAHRIHHRCQLGRGL